MPRAVSCALILLTLLCGCREPTVATKASSDPVTLYSLSAVHFNPGKAPKNVETFHGWEILDKVQVVDPAKCDEIRTALKDAMADNDGSVADCFWPRHGIRMVENGE